MDAISYDVYDVNCSRSTFASKSFRKSNYIYNKEVIYRDLLYVIECERKMLSRNPDFLVLCHNQIFKYIGQPN